MASSEHGRSAAGGPDPGRPSAVPTPLEAQNALFAEALQRLVRELEVTTAIGYVAVDRGQTLVASVVVGGPLSIFTTAERVGAEREPYTAATAHRTGTQCVRDFPESIGIPSRLDVTMPFAYTAASTPVRESGKGLGVLTLLWTPPRTLRPDERELCSRVADRLARRLAGSGVECPRYSTAMPLLLLAEPGQGSGEVVSFSPLYQIFRLASALTEAVRIRDVLDAVVSRVVAPLDAQGMAVCVTHDGQQHLLGYSGNGVEAVRAGVCRDNGTAVPRFPTLREPAFLESETALATADFALPEGVEACCVLPLASAGQPAGTFVLYFDHPRRFPAEERAVLVTMAGLLAQSLERARQFEREHALARGLQQGLLPHTLPHRGELDTAARYVTATAGTAVGGDWYDIVTLPDGNLGLVIGDVEGHSTAAAANMGQIRSAVRAYAAEGHRPSDLLGRTNRLLTDLGSDLFATCCCVWLDLATGTAEVASAGHPAPLLRHPDGDVAVPEVPVGIPLGVAPDTVYQSVEVPLPAGTIVALYTDGLVHSHTLDVSDGTKALRDLLASAHDQHLEHLATRLTAITGEGDQREDDAALLLARFIGAMPGTHQRVSRFRVARHNLAAVREVRAFLNRQLGQWGWQRVSHEVELVATELVTNALVHADSEVDIRLREYPDRIRVEVRDSDPRPPLPAPITASAARESESEHGRGLIIVESLAASWGNSPSGRGKSVWFEMGEGR
jgi:serine phosphatase RsbU (regulator of sigma subunit)/anti-sigma regulatory factor (Ser/Thr protein kinase)